MTLVFAFDRCEAVKDPSHCSSDSEERVATNAVNRLSIPCDNC